MKKKIKKIGKTVALFLLLTLLLAGVGYFAYTCGHKCGYKEGITQKSQEASTVIAQKEYIQLPNETEERVVTVSEIESTLKPIQEISTYSDNYSVFKTVEQNRQFLDGVDIPLTTNKITIRCSGCVKVGYDMESISVRVDNESKTIYISLPEATVLDNYIIWDDVECEEKNCIFNPIEFPQYQSIFNEMEDEGLEDAISEGIYDKADQNIKMIISNFLSCFEDYDIEYM